MNSLRHHRIWSSLSILLLFGSHVVAAQEADSEAAKNRAKIDTEYGGKSSRTFRAMKGAEASSSTKRPPTPFSRSRRRGSARPGAGGEGVAVDKKSNARTYMRMGSASAGFTIGVSRYDIVILFETAEKFAAFQKGGWDSAATAQATAGSSAVEVSSTFFDGIAYFQIGARD